MDTPLSGPPADPFFAPLRRRHPDVDVVLLPPEPPPVQAAPTSDDVVRDALIQVVVQARQLWATVARDDVEPGETPDGDLAFGDDEGSVRARARLATRRDDGFALLVSVRAELEAFGWEVTRPPGTLERLVGTLGDLELTASYAEESRAFGLVLTSGSLPVGVDRARVLVRASRRTGAR